MSFQYYQDKIKEGDTVMLYMSNHLSAIEVAPQKKNKKGDLVENVYQTPFGALKIRDLIDAEFGSRVELSHGWAHVLQPTPELWSLTLPHRTQIIYTPDISLILFELDLVPGSVVFEAGTGSGSLSHAIIRRVRPHGHLFSFDFHEARVQIATEEFNNHGLGDYVTCRRRDVIQNGFGEELSRKADAVFLDLPCPWDCIPFVKEALKEDGGRFVSFSPCIEQVQRTREALSRHGFHDVHHTEVLQFELKVSKRALPVRDISFLKYKGSSDPVTEKPANEKHYVVGEWPARMPGHTGYITVGSLPPCWRQRRDRIDEEDGEETKNVAAEEERDNDNS